VPTRPILASNRREHNNFSAILYQTMWITNTIGGVYQDPRSTLMTVSCF
jgi:hypothetical protein